MSASTTVYCHCDLSIAEKCPCDVELDRLRKEVQALKDAAKPKRVDPSDEQRELARRISLFLVGESPATCAAGLPAIAAFIAKRDDWRDRCFVCQIEDNLNEPRFTQSHPIYCIDNWFRKQAEWDKEFARVEKALRYERDNIEGVLKLVEEQGRIFMVKLEGTLGTKIIGLATQLQMRADKLGWGGEHFLDGSCWCEPVVEGNVVKHKGL